MLLQPSLVASTWTGWLQSRCDGVSCTTWSGTVIPRSAGSGRRPSWSPPSALICIPTAVRSGIPSYYRRPSLVSGCCICHLELVTSSCPVLGYSVCFFCQRLKTHLFRKPFPDLLLQLHTVGLMTTLRGPRNNIYVILSTLIISDWLIDWLIDKGICQCRSSCLQSINQSTFVKRHTSRANRRRVKNLDALMSCLALFYVKE